VTTRLILLLGLVLPAPAQVYSPRALIKGQPDSTDLQAFTRAICARAGTPREKAEAIWRFFLTDGRFVAPGFWYHIAGWAYEEPKGEVLDVTKLLNSYGFGLCYHIAPLLQAMFDAAGFENSRVWFLTGHTVAEVFYEGRYHYYDSDMMGYTTLGSGSPRQSVVASVRDIERDGSVITSRLKSPRETNPALVDTPWYPADVREAAIGDLAELFTTASDNHVYTGRRYSVGHSMDFVLRPGERIIRYYRPEEPGLYYLPYKYDGESWTEFPQEVAEFKIRTSDGPRSQKDARSWATGRIEYEPEVARDSPAIDIEMPCPYVIIDAAADMRLELPAGQRVTAATSIDDGRTWTEAGRIAGPYTGQWRVEAATLTRSEHGRRTAVSGTYGYRLRIQGNGVSNLKVTTRFQHNPRTLPDLQAGDNHLVYSAGPAERTHDLAIRLADLDGYKEEAGQGFVAPKSGSEAVLLFGVKARGRAALAGFRAGGRFLDICDGLMPDKLTAEVRKTSVSLPADPHPSAAIEWSTSAGGPFTPLWTYNAEVHWPDEEKIDRLLRWPEVDRTVGALPEGTGRVWVRYRLRGVALDDIRLSGIEVMRGDSPIDVTHKWTQSGQRHNFHYNVHAGVRAAEYSIPIDGTEPVQNEALILSCPR
jgi:hypothetical protein